MDQLEKSFLQARDTVHEALQVTDVDVQRLHERVMGALPKEQKGPFEKRRLLRWLSVSGAAAAVIAAWAFSTPLSQPDLDPLGGGRGRLLSAHPVEEKDPTAQISLQQEERPPVSTDTPDGLNGLLGTGGATDGIVRAVQQGLDSKVGQTASDQGIAITVNHVYAETYTLAFDLSFAFSEAWKGKEKAWQPFDEAHVFVNGKELPQPQPNVGGMQQKSEDLYLYAVDYYPLSEPLPEQFTVKVQFDRVQGTQGSWTLEFPVSRAKSRAVTRTLPLDATRTAGGVTLSAQKIELAPNLTSITYRLTQQSASADKIDPENLFIPLYSEDGKEVRGCGMTGRTVTTIGPLEVQTFTLHYDSGAQQPHVLYAMPSMIRPSDPNTFDPTDLRQLVPLNERRLPLVIRNGADTLTITKLEHRSDRTLLYFQVDGPDQPFASLRYRDGGLSLELENGDLIQAAGSVADPNGGDNAFIQVYQPLPTGESFKARVLTGIFQHNGLNLKLQFN